MQYPDVIDNIMKMADLKEKAMMVMVSDKEKELYKKAAAMDDRGLSDWIRSLARNRIRELGLADDPKASEKVRRKG